MEIEFKIKLIIIAPPPILTKREDGELAAYSNWRRTFTKDLLKTRVSFSSFRGQIYFHRIELKLVDVVDASEIYIIYPFQAMNMGLHRKRCLIFGPVLIKMQFAILQSFNRRKWFKIVIRKCKVAYAVVGVSWTTLQCVHTFVLQHTHTMRSLLSALVWVECISHVQCLQHTNYEQRNFRKHGAHLIWHDRFVELLLCVEWKTWKTDSISTCTHACMHGIHDI